MNWLDALRQFSIFLLAVGALASIMGVITSTVTIIGPGQHTQDWGVIAVLGVLGIIGSLGLIAALVHG